MSHDAILFIGAWRRSERDLAKSSVAATAEFLEERAPRYQWVFEKTGGGFSVKQPALFQTGPSASKLGDLLEEIHRAVARMARGAD